MEETILNKAQELFFSYGVKTVSMDDIARSSGVSKKTLYLSFANKNEILNRIVNTFLECHQQGLEQCRRDARDAVEEVVLSARLARQNLSVINQNFFYDIERSVPDVWLNMIAHKQKVHARFIIQNLRRGILEAYFRDDLDVLFVADVRLQQLATAMNPINFTDRNIKLNDLMLQLSSFYLHGIATTRGKKLINKYLNQNNEKK